MAPAGHIVPAVPRANNLSSNVSKKLGGPADFPDWVWCMTLLLEENGCLSMVDGTEPRPGPTADAQVRADWDRLNRRALLLLASNVEANQMTYIRPFRTAREAWVELTRVYQKAP